MQVSLTIKKVLGIFFCLLAIFLSDSTALGFSLLRVFNKPSPTDISLSTQKEKIKTECLEILDYVSQKYLNNQNFHPSKLSKEDKNILFAFYTYFMLTDLCIIHLSRDLFKTEVELKNLHKKLVPDKLNIVILDIHCPIYSNYQTKDLDQIKSEFLEKTFCQDANNLIELASCLYDKKIFIFKTHPFLTNFYHIFFPLYTTFKNKLNFILIKYPIGEVDKFSYIKYIEKTQKNSQLCIFYRNPKYNHLFLGPVNLVPRITVYCPSLHLEKEFPNQDIPTFYITEPIKHYSQDPFSFVLSLNIKNLYDLTLSEEDISKLKSKIRKIKTEILSKEIPFYKDNHITIFAMKNTKKSPVINLSNNEELYDIFINSLIHQFSIIDEIVNWLRKEMKYRKIM